MNPEILTKLREYKIKNSTVAVRSRSSLLNLFLEEEDETDFQFSYQGSVREPYQVHVFLRDIISSHCNCPYDYGGICKHEVAAIDYILEENLVAQPEQDLFGNTVKKKEEKPTKPENPLEFYLENHLISNDFLTNLAKKSRDRPNQYCVDFEEVSDDGIKTYYNDWPVYHQVISYNETTQILKTECSCRTKKTTCRHVLSALMLIENDLGEDFFHPNYLENFISEFLKNYGLTLEDNYQKYFDFSKGKNGIIVKEKVKNIFPNTTVFANEVLEELTEESKNSLFVLKEKGNITPNYGIGFCFDFFSGRGINMMNFLSFKGKLKKHTQELASSFKVINDSYHIVSEIEDLSQQEKNTIITGLEVENANEKFNRNFTLVYLRAFYIKLKEFVQQHKNDYEFFIKRNKKSFIRKHLTPISFSEETASLYFTLTQNNDFYTLKPKIRINETGYQTNSKKILITPLFCIKDNEEVFFFASPTDFFYLQKLQKKPEINFFKSEYNKIYTDVIAPLSEHFEIETKVYKTEKLAEKTNLKKQVFLSDYEGEYVVFKLGVQYDDKLFLVHSKETLFNEETQKISKRNEVFEDEFIEEFKELHPNFQEQENVFYLEPEALLEDEWLLKASQKLKQKNVEIFGVKDLKSFNFNLNKPLVSMGLKSDIDWFDVAIEIKYGNQKASLKDIRKALLKKSKYVQLKDGTLGMLPKEWLTKFEKYFKAGEVKNDSIKISNYQFNIVDDLYENLENTPDFLLELQRKKQQLQNLKDIEAVKVPKTVKATLRPYQNEGLNWLVFLHENNLGGCLADDMGLGKTLQTISLLAYLKSKKKLSKPSLIVAPTSLMFNWQKEIEKFCPSLKTLSYVGVKRKQHLENFKKYNVILTTYGSILNDIEFLKEEEFIYVILDESQAIKNPNSKRYKAVRLLKTENRLALTGTPIENNTFDLYAQMNFLNPGLLGSMAHFKTEFSDAIDKAKNESASELLHQIIHPFLLRRTKTQVATDLPEKTENILYCEMGKEQRKVYDAFKNKFREYLLEKIDENGAEKSQMYVLEGLTKLRQICDSPQLLNDEEDYGSASVKLDMLVENVKTITSEGSKVLVFSQFTSMLSLIKERLETENITYEYLDGKTRNREEKVQNFQENDSVKVFLISLKAGGTGLNLTKAEYVFLVDPWWNPAVENQAIDRCYRIGQTKKVMAYRMICKDTIEEKIVDLQQNKKAVSNSIIQVDKLKKSFDKQQIKELFS